MVRGRLVAVSVAVAAVTGTGVLALSDPASGPAGRLLTADNPGAGADPAVTEVGAPPCSVALPGASLVATLLGATARCLGSAQPVDVGAAVAGRATLLNLWASWCAPCREEMPVLDKYQDTAGAVRVIGVNVRDRPSSAAALVRDLNIRYPSFTDADAEAAALEAPQLLPVSYLVDTDGSGGRQKS